MWHHTASGPSTSEESIARYHATGSSNAPVCNLDIARDGSVWVIAAGPTNTNGKGNATRTSRAPSGRLDEQLRPPLGIEFSNMGRRTGRGADRVGFAIVANLQRRLGLQSTDVFTHAEYAPSRKIDPATAGPCRDRGGPARSQLARGRPTICAPNAPPLERGPTPEEPDMTDEQAQMLDEIHAALFKNYDPPVNDPFGNETNLQWANAYGYTRTEDTLTVINELRGVVDQMKAMLTDNYDPPVLDPFGQTTNPAWPPPTGTSRRPTSSRRPPTSPSD